MNRQYNTEHDNSYVFQEISRKFCGRGISYFEKGNFTPVNKSAGSSSGSVASDRNVNTRYSGAENQKRAANVTAPMTLADFERNFYSHSNYRPMTQKNRVAGSSNNRMAAPVQKAKKPAEKPALVRRAVSFANKADTPIGDFVKSFRHLPVATVLTVIACAVSLMFIVGSSVMLNDASNEYVDMQREISALAEKENKLSLQLEEKNDLRKIEDVAVNKLGMVKKDLVTREYIKLNDGDVIEIYESSEENVGIANLLSAIGIGD